MFVIQYKELYKKEGEHSNSLLYIFVFGNELLIKN